MQVEQLPHMGYEENPQIKVLTDKLDLPKTKAQTVFDKFSDYLRQAAEMEKVIDQYVVTDVSQVENMERMKKISKALQRIRIDAEATRKVEKADSLNEGRLIDGINNVILGLIAPMEAKANASAKFIEIAEQKKRDDLRKARVDALRPYTPDAEIMPVTDMTEEGFNQLLESMKAGHEKRLKDAQDLADQKKADDERLRLENESLRRYQHRLMQLTNLGASIRDGVINLYNPYAKEDETVSVHVEESLLKGMPDDEFFKTLSAFSELSLKKINAVAAENAKKEKERIATNAKLLKANEERLKLEREAREKFEKEEQERKDELKAKRKANNAPDLDKAQALINTMNDQKKELPKMSTDEGKKIISDVETMYVRMMEHVQKKMKTLEE